MTGSARSRSVRFSSRSWRALKLPQMICDVNFQVKANHAAPTSTTTAARARMMTAPMGVSSQG